MEKASRKTSTTEPVESNQFCRLDNNLINNIAAFVGNSKDILNLTQCSKEMKYLFQKAQVCEASLKRSMEANIKVN